MITIAVLSFLPVQAAEWDWLKSANMSNLSNETKGMLILPMSHDDEFVFYLAPADFVGQNTIADCGISYYEDPLNYLVRGYLSSSQSNYIVWKSDGHHLAMLTCGYSSGDHGNVHMVAGDNAILRLPETDPLPEPMPEPQSCCPQSKYDLLFSYCPDTDPCLTEDPTIQVYSFKKKWYLKILTQWTGLLWIDVPEPSDDCCPDYENLGIAPEFCPMNSCYAQYLGQTQYQLWSDGQNWYVHDSIALKSYRIYLR